MLCGGCDDAFGVDMIDPRRGALDGASLQIIQSALCGAGECIRLVPIVPIRGVYFAFNCCITDRVSGCLNVNASRTRDVPEIFANHPAPVFLSMASASFFHVSFLFCTRLLSCITYRGSTGVSFELESDMDELLRTVMRIGWLGDAGE